MPVLRPDLKLSSPVTELPGIGLAKAKILARLNITHIRNLLFNFPRRHDDFSTITPIKDLTAGKTMTVHGRVKSFKSSWGFQGRRRVLRIFVDIEDDTGILSVTWYNLQFLARQLWQGREIYIAGKVEDNSAKTLNPSTYSRQPKYRMRSPILEFADKDQEHTHTGRITPVYSETKGVSSRFLRYQVKNILSLASTVPEYLPESVRKDNNLLGIQDALRSIHFPKTTQELEQAQHRLRFDELFFLQLAALVRRRMRSQRKAYVIKKDKTALNGYVRDLPFALTNAQTRALEDIAKDMSSKEPMNRLLQGVVGSGKSAVALVTARSVLTAGHTVLYMAPTEILARQQTALLAEALPGHSVELLISAQTRKHKQSVKSRLSDGEVMCVVGTHALLQEDVTASNCALAIVDEQHRFGVEQRRLLQNVNSEDRMPHLLSMTATPIPRTLTLTVYGDLDVSVLNELPPGRQPIDTKVVHPEERDDAVLHILEQLHAGRQAYVIAPLVEDSEKLEVKSAKSTFKEMQSLFPDVAVGLLHGQMASEEKAAVLSQFSAGALQLLVATAVVEVGVNVPNATVMIIEGAERFGLAQLHQFRGRIGRGSEQSYCYLFPTEASYAGSPRLRVLAETTDGFKIAEEDLKLRGPGEVYGIAQSGFGHLQVASLLDYPTIRSARDTAETILAEDPELENYPILKAKVAQKNMATHFE